MDDGPTVVQCRTVEEAYDTAGRFEQKGYIRVSVTDAAGRPVMPPRPGGARA